MAHYPSPISRSHKEGEPNKGDTKMKPITDILHGTLILCGDCGTTSFMKINGNTPEDFEDYGIIVCHKKDCERLKKLIEHSVKV